jgi:WD40 repeat protein/uncharacterized caspase-like protein
MRLPDPQRSYAVLVGTSRYRATDLLPDVPHVGNNLTALAEVLTSPMLGGLRTERCKVLEDPADGLTVVRTLRTYAAAAEDTLLVYYAGHGLPGERYSELFLGLSGTDPQEVALSALPVRTIRDILAYGTPARNRILILDCCFSGRATESHLGSSDDVIKAQITIEGTYTLTSAPGTTYALYDPGSTYTAFTDMLLTLLRTGISGEEAPEFLTLDEIYRQLRFAALHRNLPEPQQLNSGTAAGLALSRNPAHIRRPSVPPADTPVEDQTDSLDIPADSDQEPAPHAATSSTQQTGKGTAVARPFPADGPARPWMAPPLDRMIERPDVADLLVRELTAPEASDVALTTGLQGAGGFGKTQLAAWVSHLPAIDRRYPGGLLWVTVGQDARGADLAGKINDLVFVLSGTRPAVFDPDAAGAELGRRLDSLGKPVLLIVDDVWAEEQLRPFRSGGRSCTRLVTTRIPEALPIRAHRIIVDAMSDEQARLLIADGVAGLSPGSADRLARLTGRWPVLLNLVNGTLARNVQRKQTSEQAAAAIAGRLLRDGPTAFDPAHPGDRARAVAATVAASLNLLDAEDRPRFLELALFPEDVEIPQSMLVLLWPSRRVEALCEDLAELGLVADYRLDPPGPRLLLHDVMRAYLRAEVGHEEMVAAHRRFLDAAARLLPDRKDADPVPWWRLPTDVPYLWRHLAYHLAEADRGDELARLVSDLRWAESKILVSGSAVGVDADLSMVGTATTEALRRALRQAAALLGPIDPPQALGATLASRLRDTPELRAVLDAYRTTMPRPLLEPVWPLPDLADSASPGPVGHSGGVTSCAFSPDGALLASSSDDATVRIWDVETAAELAVLTGHTGGVWSCAFSPDGARLASAGNDGTVRLWDVASGTTKVVLNGHDDWVRSCAFSPDGALLASSSDDATVRIWDVETAAELAVLTGHTGGVWSCAFSPDGARLASAGKDGTVRLWDVASGTTKVVLNGHDDWVTSCAFSPDGMLLATTSNDQTARVWRVDSGTEQAKLTGHTSRVWSCAFSPDGTQLATTSIDGTTRLWDVAGASTAVVLGGHSRGVRGCAFSPAGGLLATCSSDLSVRLWQLPAATEKAVLAGHSSGQRGCAFSPDGTLLATTSNDSTAQVWKVDGRKLKALLTRHTGGLRRCAFSPDGTLLATVSNDQTARLWNAATSMTRLILTGHSGWVRACAFSPDGMFIATTGADRTVRLWRVADGTQTAVFTGHADMVNGCAFSPDGALLATSGDDGTAILWRVADGARLRILTDHSDGVNTCAFSPDGGLLATASDDRTVKLWRMPDCTLMGTLTGHTSWVDDCAFSPDGQLLATCGNDGTVRVWEPESRRCRCAIRVAGPLLGIAWHPGAEMLCAVGGAGTYAFAYREQPDRGPPDAD